MSFADKKLRSRQRADQGRPPPHVPMGDQRFQQLMRALGDALAQADDGADKRRQARDRDAQHAQWLAERETAAMLHMGAVGRLRNLPYDAICITD